jgi:hypothetical protein
LAFDEERQPSAILIDVDNASRSPASVNPIRRPDALGFQTHAKFAGAGDDFRQEPREAFMGCGDWRLWTDH